MRAHNSRNVWPCRGLVKKNHYFISWEVIHDDVALIDLILDKKLMLSLYASCDSNWLHIHFPRG